MYRLFVAAIAMMFSVGCHAVCKIFLVKSKLSTLMSSFLLLPPTQTLRGLRMARGLLLSREASKVTSRLVLRSNIRKKLLYAPVIITLQRDRERHTTKALKQQPVQSLPTWLDQERQVWPLGQLSSGFRWERVRGKKGVFPVLPRMKSFLLTMPSPPILSNENYSSSSNVCSLTSWESHQKIIKATCFNTLFLITLQLFMCA